MLADLVKVVEDQHRRKEEAGITVRLADGESISHQVTEALGSPRRPVPIDRARRKFRGLWQGEDGGAVFDRLLVLDTLPDAGDFARHLRTTALGD